MATEDEQNKIDAQGFSPSFGTATVSPEASDAMEVASEARFERPQQNLETTGGFNYSASQQPQMGRDAGGNAVNLSALDAATQNLGPGQSVQDAGMEAVEASATAAAQETRDRMRAGREGITSPPSAWAQDVNNLFAGLTSAARRAAERLSQPQQGQTVQPVQNPVQNQQDPFSMAPPPSSVQPIKKAGMMVLGAQDFGSSAQAKADEFIGGYFD